MQFSIAVLALAAGVSAAVPYPVASNQTYVTEVVSSLVTYCSEATTITYGEKTYTVTKATTLTITDCPCTVSKPVYSSAVTECKTCTSKAPTYPTVYPNATAPAVTSYSVKPTGALTTSASSTPSVVPNAAGKVAALSGAGLAGVLGLFAALL